MTIEVFKTNVTDQAHAQMLIEQIKLAFNGYANFDLEDCDKILRVKKIHEDIQPYQVIELLKDFGFNAEVLQDNTSLQSRFENPLHFIYN